ncbi:Crp/Fnr family transcriptional regulator [Humitalea sp. 24SJ18S-53]|uniref:Crp/Fnr family transcriptional regulator n=1 Tax=Humitalea sp. 24SJ18S-53 TaxID=3422307 RepID=UPI003D677A71
MPGTASDQPDRVPGAAPAASGIDALRRLPFLADVAEDALRRLATQARWRVLAAGEMVMDAGDTSDDVFFIAEGALRVLLRSAAGEEIILNDLGPGAIFGELAAIDGIRRSANVSALLRSRLCVVPGPAFLDLVLHAPPAGQRLLRMLAERLRLKDERNLEAAALPLRQRVLAELLRLSRPRAGGERMISPPPPQHVLAARLVLRRETVSREIARLARAGVLTVGRGAIILHRPEEIGAEIDALLRAAAGA